MGNFAFTVPALGNKFVDYRQPIMGDSFNWSWVRPMSQVRYLAIHHSAGPDTQTPDDIARYHVQSRGWGGVGYHFIIAKNGTTYYVGDLTTARAHVANRNEQVIGICLIGTFMNGKEPTGDQIIAAHLLCAQMLFRTPELPGTDGWEDLVGHKSFSATACPGDTWNSYRSKIITASTPTTPTPVPSNQRREEITSLYRIVLGREPDQVGLEHYVNGSLNMDQIRKAMTESSEHQAILSRAKNFKELREKTQEALDLSGRLHGKLEEMNRVGQ